MAKGNGVKPPVSDGVHVETVVIDDEEGNPVLPDDGRDIEHEFILNPADNSSHVFDKDLQVDPVVNPVVDPVFHSPIKGKPAEPNLSGSYPVGGMVHPLFVNCLLEKIPRMEGEVTEMVANHNVIKAENSRLKEKVDSDDKCLLRLKKHKNRLIRRVLKLQNESHKNEEKVCELNAQVTLMQFKGDSQNPANGVNIQVFNGPVNL